LFGKHMYFYVFRSRSIPKRVVVVVVVVAVVLVAAAVALCA